MGGQGFAFIKEFYQAASHQHWRFRAGGNKAPHCIIMPVLSIKLLSALETRGAVSRGKYFRVCILRRVFGGLLACSDFLPWQECQLHQAGGVLSTR